MKLVDIYKPLVAVEKKLNTSTGAIESYSVIKNPKHKFVARRKIMDRVFDKFIDADPETVALGDMYIEEVTDSKEIEKFTQDKKGALKKGVKAVKEAAKTQPEETPGEEQTESPKRGRKPKED